MIYDDPEQAHNEQRIGTQGDPLQLSTPYPHAMRDTASTIERPMSAKTFSCTPVLTAMTTAHAGEVGQMSSRDGTLCFEMPDPLDPKKMCMQTFYPVRMKKPWTARHNEFARQFGFEKQLRELIQRKRQGVKDIVVWLPELDDKEMEELSKGGLFELPKTLSSTDKDKNVDEVKRHHM